jgi:lipopolysaccharide transport system permease protein
MNRRHAIDVVVTLVERDLKVRYRHSVLGVAWSQLGPLAMLVIVSFVFTRVVPLHVPNYPLFVVIGLLAWTWFAAAVDIATRSIVDARELVQRPGVTATALPTAAVVTQLVHFLLALPIVVVVELLVLGHLPATIIALPAVVLAQLVVTLPLAWLLAALHVRWRDVGHGVTLLLMPLFYATPIFYPPGRVPARWRHVFELNPLAPLITGYRDVMLYGRWPTWSSLAVLLLVGVVLGMACRQLVARRAHLFAEEV